MQHPAGHWVEYLPRVRMRVELQAGCPLRSSGAELRERERATGESGNSTAPDHIRGALSPWRAAEAGS